MPSSLHRAASAAASTETEAFTTKTADSEVAQLLIELSADEIAPVSGGIDPQGPIIVTGTRMRINIGDTGSGVVERTDYEQFPTLMPVDPESGGGGSWMEPALDTSSCISSTPAGHDVAEINNVASAIAADIGKKSTDDNWEYGAVIYSLNGTIGFTRTVTQRNRSRVNYPMSEVPEWAVILALVHNHPDVQFIDDGYPSTDPTELDDWDYMTTSKRGTRRRTAEYPRIRTC